MEHSDTTNLNIIEPQNSQNLKPKSTSQFSQTIDAKIGGDETQNSIKVEQTLSTIASDDVADNDFRVNSDHHLSEVPVKYSLSPLEVLVAIKDHVFENHQKTLGNIPAQAAEVEDECQLQSNDPSLPEFPAPSATQSMSSITSPMQQNLSVADNEMLVSVLDKEKENAFKHKSPPIVPVSKKSSPDGYNWRKYGQKQVKSPEGSRSYYRCTHCECYAKKIECSDYTHRVIDTVYRSQHNHDPPNKVSCSPESRPPPVDGHSKTENSSTGPDAAVPCAILETYAEQRASTSVLKEHCRDGSDVKSEINVDDEDSNEAETRKGLKNKSDPNSPEALSKAGKKPKLVVHAAGDVVISGDGFRWRKYGQKMVKGNPHPRNYYRCTSAGCPVRKHIEKAVDDPIAAIITYKGEHDHDVPVPKKHQALPSPIFAATAVGDPAPVQGKMRDQLQKRISQVNGQWTK